ncbi:MAG: hypothetical protein RSB70_00485 [Clostridium sp.]
MTLKFTLFEEVIEITKESDNYNSLRKDFDEFSYMQSEKFCDIFKNSYSNIEILSENALRDGFVLIMESIDKALAILVNYNILDVDRKGFFSNYYATYYSWDMDFNIINNKYLSLVMQEKDLYEINLKYSNLRSQWREKGYPIDGSIIEISKANDENMSLNLSHKNIKFKGRSIRGIGNFIEKSKLINDSYTMDFLKIAIYQGCCNVHKALIDCLHSKGVQGYGSYVSHDVYTSMEALFNNITVGVIPEEKIKKSIIRIIRANPYEYAYYKFIIINLGDENNEIDKIADYYGVYGLQDFKLSLIKDEFNQLNLSTEENTLSSKESLLNTMKFLGVSIQNPYYNIIEGVLKNFDLNARTVDNIEFTTREIALLAIDDKKKIDVILGSIIKEKELDISEALDKLKRLDLNTILKVKYIDILNQRLSKVIELEDYDYLDENFNIKSFYTEDQCIETLDKLRSINLRTSKAVDIKEREITNKLNQIIENKDMIKIENVVNSYLFFNLTNIQEAVEQLRVMEVRSSHIKGEKIDYLLENSRFIINNHLNLLEKAKKYENKINEKEYSQYATTKKGFIGSLKKVFGDTINKVNDILSEDDKRAWEFITNNGVRAIKDLNIHE